MDTYIPLSTLSRARNSFHAPLASPLPVRLSRSFSLFLSFIPPLCVLSKLHVLTIFVRAAVWHKEEADSIYNPSFAMQNLLHSCSLLTPFPTRSCPSPGKDRQLPKYQTFALTTGVTPASFYFQHVLIKARGLRTRLNQPLSRDKYHNRTVTCSANAAVPFFRFFVPKPAVNLGSTIQPLVQVANGQGPASRTDIIIRRIEP